MRASFLTTSEAETIALGRALAAALRPADVLTIEGDLGAGKTRLVRGVASALGVADGTIASPTYVIAHAYPATEPPNTDPTTAVRTVHHLDAYRLSGGDELDSIGWERIIGDPHGVVLVEWPSRIADALSTFDPDRLARLRIEPIGDEPDQRVVSIVLPPAWSDRVGLESLFSWALGSAEQTPASGRLLSGKLPAGWRRCPITGRAVSPSNPTFPFADAKARDADLNRWFTGSYAISRDVTADDTDDPDLLPPEPRP